MAEFVEFPRAALAGSLVGRFEAQVARHPERVAVRAGDEALTYAELNAAANRVGRAVRARLGDAPGAVALLLADGPLVPAALLGVLKAGGVYVPLHAAHPLDRTATVVADAGARLVLADATHAAQATALAARVDPAPAVLRVEDMHGGDERDLGVAVGPDDACFVIYTSGSTGQPKGVCQLHRTMLHGTWAYTDLAGLHADDRFALIHGITTQVGATGLFAALLNGATLLPFDLAGRGLDALAAWLVAERITVLHPMPTVFRRLAARLAPAQRLDDVRLVRLAGEPVTQTEWRLFRAHCPDDAAMLVALGSTEALNYRQRIYRAADDPRDAVLPVGDPVPDKDVLLVDAHGAPVAPGEVGEILVRSAFLFGGYWRRPDLTDAVLVPDAHDPRIRTFRTGDLGRWLPDGRFFHAGRRDGLVKVAGNRVETAEIEAALRRVPAIRDAAVVPRRRDDGGDARLVAFVAVAGEPPSRAAVRAQLAATLPAHMVPAAFVVVDDLPVLATGKVDRGALAARVAAAQPAHVPPRNAVEETLQALWQRALGVDGVGIHDDFFLDLGGDSLAATQLLAEIAAVFGRELPLGALLDAATIATLGARLVDAGWQPPADGRLVLHADGPHPPLVGLCGAFGHALRLLVVGRALGPAQPFVALEPPGMDWEAAGCRTLEAMAAHYVQVVRVHQPDGPYRLVGTSLGGVLAFEMAVQLQRTGAAVALLAMIDTAPPTCIAPHGVDREEGRDWAAGVPPGDALVEAGLRVARAHRAAYDAYVLRRRFDGAIVYFHCLEPPVPRATDRRRLWRHFATDGVRVIPVPGVHGHFHREPQLSAVVAGLRDALAGC